MERMILHSDLNNYYASVECVLNPTLAGKPLAVCGSEKNRHGIVLARSQPAKQYGVKTGETIWQAKQKCPGLIIVPPRFEEYAKFSALVRSIYSRYTDQVEPFGLDECWLDVGQSQCLFGNGSQIAEEIRAQVKKESGLTVSVGVSFNKIFAKLGSDLKKPDAVTCISSKDFRNVVWPLNVSALLGVGRSAAARLHKYGIDTIGQLAQCDPLLLRSWFGLNGTRLYEYANGLDQSRVLKQGEFPAAKSVGHGITCAEDLLDASEVWAVLLKLSAQVSHRLREIGFLAGGVSLVIKDNLLHCRDRHTLLPRPTRNFQSISQAAMALFRENYSWDFPVRALSVTATRLSPIDGAVQPNFFADPLQEEKSERLELALEEIRSKFGVSSICPASALNERKMPPVHQQSHSFLPGTRLL